MAPKRQPRLDDPSPTASSSSSGAGGSASANPITFSHFAEHQTAPPTPPIKKESKSDEGFKVSFQFVGNQDARKATTENRSHVMREYRRKQRWEQDQKKKKMKEEQQEKQEKTQHSSSSSSAASDSSSSGGGGGGDRRGSTSAEKLLEDSIKEEPDLGKIIALSRETGKLPKRKRSLDEDDYGRGLLEDLDSETSQLAIQLLTQLTSPQIRQPSAEGPIMDVFTQRFVDNFAPQARNAGSATAIRSIATVRMYSTLVSNAMNAVATTYAGQQVGDKQILDAGHGIYTDVLKSLQQALAHPLYRSEAVLATVVLCIAYESMRHTTPEALARHCTGVLQLIEYRGPHAHVHGLEHLCFAELRPYWAFAAIVFRTPTFLQNSEWKTIPWSAPDATKDIMQHLLDHIVDLPSILYQSDTLKAALASAPLSTTTTTTSPVSPSDIPSLRNALWADIQALFDRLLAWRSQHADTYPAGPPIDTKAPLGSDPFPVFRTRNPRSGQVLSPPPVAYPDPQLCRTLCTFYGALIVLASVDSRPVEGNAGAVDPPFGWRVKPLQIFGWACLICRSVEYFIRNVPGNMTNRMMFPLRAAWEVMPKDGPERAFLTGVWEVIGKRRASTVWTKLTKEDDVG